MNYYVRLEKKHVNYKNWSNKGISFFHGIVSDARQIFKKKKKQISKFLEML